MKSTKLPEPSIRYGAKSVELAGCNYYTEQQMLEHSDARVRAALEEAIVACDNADVFAADSRAQVLGICVEAIRNLMPKEAM